MRELSPPCASSQEKRDHRRPTHHGRRQSRGRRDNSPPGPVSSPSTTSPIASRTGRSTSCSTGSAAHSSARSCRGRRPRAGCPRLRGCRRPRAHRLGPEHQRTGRCAAQRTFIQGFELDDFHPFAPLHSASLIVPALLAASELAGDVDGAAFVRAAVVGFEVGRRVGLALHGSEMLTRGWHSGSVFGPIAVAAAVRNLLGLDAEQIEDALGLGATQAAGLMAAQFGAMSKRMHHGMASRNGLRAAMLASGPPDTNRRSLHHYHGP